MMLQWLKGRSIAMRLFLSAAFWSIVILLTAAFILTTLYIRDTEVAFDKRLNVYLRALVADVASMEDEGRSDPGQLGDPQFLVPFSGWYWQITRTDGKSGDVHSSRSLSASKLPRLADLGVQPELGGLRSGYFQGPDDRRLRMVERLIDTGENGIYLVQVAGNAEELAIYVTQFELRLGLAFLLLAIALVASVALQVRFGLVPLRHLQEGVSAIRRGEAEKIDGIDSPDLAPLASELNLLLASNREIVERARTHVGNLAHALKTPLSVIFNEARNEGSPLARKIEEQIGTMKTQLDIYLERARAVARASVVGSSTDIKPALEALARTFGKIYRDKNFMLDAPLDEYLRFRGEKQDFDELVGNLLDNAGKWAAKNVHISVEPEPSTVGTGRNFFVLAIEDDGRGMTSEEYIEATKRGKRLDETVPGTGLGLSIVSELAAAYGGSLQLAKSGRGGLRVALRLPSF